MDLIAILGAAVAGIGGVVIGSVMNYYILRKLFRKQAIDIVDLVAGTGEFDEFVKLVRGANEFFGSEDAKEMLEQVKRILKEL